MSFTVLGKSHACLLACSAKANVDVWIWGDWEFRPVQYGVPCATQMSAVLIYVAQCSGRAGWAPSVKMQVSGESNDDGTVPMRAMSDIPAAVVMDPNNPMCLEGIVSLLVQFGYVSTHSTCSLCPCEEVVQAC